MIVVINNYPSRTEPRFQHLLQAVENILKKQHMNNPSLQQQIYPIHFSDIKGDFPSNPNATISSGSSYNLPSDFTLFEEQIEIIQQTTSPFLGICYGHELLGLAFGGKLGRISILKSKFEEIKIMNNDPLLTPFEINDQLILAESHHKIVKPIPKDFKLLGETIEHHVEIMKHLKYPLYGVQGHPERATSKYPHGFQLLKNFFSIVDNFKSL